MYHNDYTVLITNYLYSYSAFRAFIRSTRADIEDCKEKLKLSAAPKVPVLSPAGGCGGAEDSSQQEKEYYKKEDLEEKLYHYYHDLQELEPVLTRLDRALASLKEVNSTGYKILQLKHIGKGTWPGTARSVGASEHYCRNEAKRAIRWLAVAVFGPAAAADDTLIFVNPSVEQIRADLG